MSGPHYPGFATLALHAGAAPAAASAMLEERIAALEGGVAAIATSSGQAALHLGLSTICGAGAHIVASAALHAGAQQLLAHTLKRYGIHTTFVDPRDAQAWRAAIRPDTRLLLAETLGSAGLEVLDIPTVAAIAHERRVPLMVDATQTTPWLLRPFDHGADLIVHSAAMGGLLVDGGTFDWQAAYEDGGRYAELCEPYEGYPNMVFSEDSTVAAYTLRARHEGLQDFGAAISQHHAAGLLHGLETLGLRMERHIANTRKVVGLLAAHPAVVALNYPELASHPDHAVAARLLPNGCGAVLMLQLKAGRAFVDRLQLIARAADVGGAKSHAVMPATDSGTVRLSIGLEDADDLLEDLSRALKLSQKGT